MTMLRRLKSRVLRDSLKVFGVGILALLVAGVALLLQIRSDYYARVSVNLAASYADRVMLAIDGHRARYETLPASLSDLALPAGEPGYVPELAFDASTGTLYVAVETEHGNFGSLHYVQSQDSSAAGRWRCVNVSVAMSLLPAQCTQINESLSR
jgi:hypothetical protein